MIKRALYAIGNSVFWICFLVLIISKSMGIKNVSELMIGFMIFGISLNISSLFIKFDIEPDDFEDDEEI